MSVTDTESSAADPAAILTESSTSTPALLSSSSPSKTVDDETKRRKILSKLWGKGNKLSHKVRELDKSTISNSSDSSIHNDNDQQQLTDNSNNHLSYASTNDPKSSTEDSSNSINSSKPLAVVKPIVVVKSGLMVSPAADRTRVNSEASSTTITQIDEPTTTTVTERQSSSTTKTTTDRTSSKKKKSHKKEDSKKKKSTRDESNERDRLQNHHQTDEKSNKKTNSSSKNSRREKDEEVSINNNHHKSSHYHSSSTTSSSNHKRRSPSNDIDHKDRRSSRSTTSRKDEPSSSKRSTLSPVDHHRHSSSKYETSNHSSHHHHRRSTSRTPSPSRTRHTTTNGDRTQRKKSSSPKKDDRSSTTATKTVSNSKSTNSISPSDSYSNHRLHGSDIATDHDSHRHKTRTSEEQLTNSSKSQEISPDHHYHRSSSKQEKSKTSTNNDDNNNSNRHKQSSSRHDQRSHSRHRSRSKENKTNRKTIEPSNSDEHSTNKTKTNHEKDSITVNEHSTNEKKSSRGSSIPSSHDDHRRKSSSDYHRYDRHDSPSNYDRRNDHHHRHRIPSPHSYYPNMHYVHHHHHHHYRSTSSRYRYHRRSISPRSRDYRSRYFSSTSSSLSPSPHRRRRSPSRTSSSSSRSSSSYSSISRTSSSRSSSRHNHYYHHDKKYRRSPTLEKLFLKASESIESVSTTKNPNATHLISIPTSNTTSDIQMSSPINSLSESKTFYPDSFSGFSAPPPPFISQPQQRCLKEITTQSPTSRRFVLNELQTPIQSSTSSLIDEVIPVKTAQSSDLSTNVRSGSGKPRISRFSDITPTVTSEPPLNTNISVDTPLNYTQISENINCLPSSRRQQKRHNREVMECECTTSEYDRSRGIKACGHECLNRMLLIECSSICPCGQWCTNRRFQRRSYASHKLALFKTEMKGYGLRTVSSIRKSRFLVEYVGEVIDMDELARRNKKYKRDGNIHQYVMSLIHGTVIDSTIKGNWARYINHSCEPNCSAEKWLVNGEYRMGIFAKRDLDINEEITIDYRFETFGAVDLANEKCYCGAPTCRGTISVKSNNNSNKRINRRQPLDDDELLDYLRDDETNEYITPKTIEEIRQLIQIMSRTDSENVRTIELDLIKNNSQKQFELPRLFLECNGLHVLCSWMKDILIEDNEQQQYSDEFKYHLLDFIHSVLPIKDRTTVIKNGLLDLVHKKLKLPLSITDNNNNDHEQINNLMNSILDHLDNPIIAKLFHIYSTWMSLKERYIIPKRKEPQQISNHYHHRHHHHHSSKHAYEENNDRFKFSTRSSTIYQKPIDRPYEKRSFVMRDTPRTQEQQLSKDERRKLFEQQYEDAEKARAAAAAAAINGESPGGQNEPPYKKQRKSDSTGSILPNTPPQSQTSMPDSHQMDQIYSIHQYLSQIPIEYIRSYMTSIGMKGEDVIPVSSTSTDKDEPPLPPPPRPDDENELSRITRLPSGWSVTMCPSDSSVYYYNRETMTTSWTPPVLGTPTENSASVLPLLDLSPLSSAQITEQRRPHHQLTSSSRAAMKLSKYPHRHSRNHRHHHHHINSNNKRKRPSEIESTTVIKEEPQPPSTEESSMIISNEHINQDTNDKKPDEQMEEMSVTIPKTIIDETDETDMSTTVKESSEINDNMDEQISSNDNTLSSSSKNNRDILRRNISQHVHATIKPYTKRTCKQGRIVSTDDIKYLVKKFTLAVLDKEIEKAKNDGFPLSPILTDRVRLKTEVYVKKYMNKMGPVFQRHEPNVHPSSQPLQPTATTTTETNSE